MTYFVTRPLALAALTALFLAPLTAYQDAPPYRIRDGVSAPVPIQKAEPEYTEEARRERIEGPVILAVLIDSSGNPTDIQVVKSLDPGLDTQAIQALKQWRFRPGMKDGRPVAVEATVEIIFKLL